ncbi:MAG: ferritin [Sporomusaceae bacterium]|nr:ferritin [Sporomusaceae bacterium]
MIANKVRDAINTQIQKEYASAYLYLAMAADCESKNLKGFAAWLRLQYEEEVSHALKLYDYLLERGGTVSLLPLQAPPAEFGTPLQLFEQVLAHEQHVTASIHALYELALAEKDYATQVFLQWFISEQVEEEASASEVLEKIRMTGDRALVYLDKELGKRGRD